MEINTGSSEQLIPTQKIMDADSRSFNRNIIVRARMANPETIPKARANFAFPKSRFLRDFIAFSALVSFSY